MKLFLIRHGETDDLLNKIRMGHKQSPLNEKGIEQAKQTADYLTTIPVDQIYSSDLARVKQGTQLFLKNSPCTQVIYSDQLRERTFGEFEDKPCSLYSDLPQTQEEYEFAPVGGESCKAFEERIINFFNYMVSKHDKQTVFLFGHGGVIVTILMHLRNQSTFQRKDYHIKNGSITCIEINKDTKNIVFENSTEHLK